jgi:hypothetical protein
MPIYLNCAMRTYGGMDAEIQVFLTSALTGDEQ